MYEKIRTLFFSSAAYNICQKLFQSPIFLFLTDFSYVSELTHRSFIYRHLSKKLYSIVRRVSEHSRRIRAAFSPLQLALAVLVIPQALMTRTAYITLACAVLLIALRSAQTVNSCLDCMLFLLLYAAFAACITVFLPAAVSLPPLRLLTAASIYFSVIRSGAAPSAIGNGVFIAITARAVFSFVLPSVLGFTPTADFAEALILLTPLSLAAETRGVSRTAARMSTAAVLIFAARYVLSTRSYAAYVGFFTAIILYLAVSSPKYLILWLFLTPAAVISVIKSFIGIWTYHSSAASPAEAVIRTAVNFWNKGFSIDSSVFFNAYKNTSYIIYSQSLPHIFEIYADVFFKIGHAVLFIFLWYNIKLIRSAFKELFFADTGARRIYAAALSSLMGIAVCNSLSPSRLGMETLAAYCLVTAALSVHSSNT